jgi:FixJ family two-component response regulator
MNAVRSAVIAVVDDEKSIRKALLRLLRAAGRDARAYASGKEFLDTLSFIRYDCLVLDLHMPGLTGFDVLREHALIQARLPTIVITVHDEAGTREKCFAEGVIAYICKPFDEKTLLGAVEEALGNGFAV